MRKQSEPAEARRAPDHDPMSGSQRTYLKTLTEEANEPFDASLTADEASRRIDELQIKTGRLRD